MSRYCRVYGHKPGQVNSDLGLRSRCERCGANLLGGLTWEGAAMVRQRLGLRYRLHKVLGKLRCSFGRHDAVRHEEHWVNVESKGYFLTRCQECETRLMRRPRGRWTRVPGHWDV